MSLNAALNATVALIEGRTDIAKEIIRQPGSDVKNVPAILARLERAVNKAAARAIRNALLRTLALTADEAKQRGADDGLFNLEDAYFLGVDDTEKLLEEAASELDPK